MTTQTNFNTRKPTWNGLGTDIRQAQGIYEALASSGLDWNVYQQTMTTEEGIPVTGYLANIRDTDDKVLGVVTDKYQVVQNHEAFAFTEELLGHGVRYETAGMLQEGRKTWILAKMPQRYQMSGDWIEPYLVFYNTHDGSGSLKVALTPIRVTCQNTLNLALRRAKRSWSTKHTGDIRLKLEDAKETLFRAEQYMDELGNEMNYLTSIRISDHEADAFINELIAQPKNATQAQQKNTEKLREDLRARYHHAPDLASLPGTGYRLINAVSDFATHTKPLRQTPNHQENLFARTIDGHPLIDRAHRMILQMGAA